MYIIFKFATSQLIKLGIAYRVIFKCLYGRVGYVYTVISRFTVLLGGNEKCTVNQETRSTVIRGITVQSNLSIIYMNQIVIPNTYYILLMKYMLH